MIRGLEVFVGSNGKNVTLVEMFFCVKVHIIIFKEEVRKVVIDASTCEFDNGFLLSPKSGEGNFGVRSRRDKGKFLWGKDMTCKGFAVTTNRLDINTYRSFRKDTSNGLFAMGKGEIELTVDS